MIYFHFPALLGTRGMLTEQEMAEFVGKIKM